MSSIHHIYAWYRHHLEMTLQLLPSIRMRKKTKNKMLIHIHAHRFDRSTITLINSIKFNVILIDVSHGKPHNLSNIIFNRYWAIANESTTTASTVDVFSKLLINIFRWISRVQREHLLPSMLFCNQLKWNRVFNYKIVRIHSIQINFENTQLPFKIPVFLNADWFSVNLSLVTVYFRNIQRMWFEI